MLSATMIKDTLHTICVYLQTPTIIGLLFFMIVAILVSGSFFVELFTERRRLKGSFPQLVGKLKGKSFPEIKNEIQSSGLLQRQKALLNELLEQSSLPATALEAEARRLLSSEELYYERSTMKTDLIARLGPMLGLMGTLIPLGPGLIALGRGDTKTLADSLLIAFDTTIAGLASASVCFAISRLRKHWYEDYLTALEAVMTSILEVPKPGGYKLEKEPAKKERRA